MRLDKYLQATGILSRRTKAKQACDAGLIEIDGKPAKASAEVRPGQKITMRLGLKVVTYEVLDVPQRVVAKSVRDDYRRLVGEEPIELDL